MRPSSPLISFPIFYSLGITIVQSRKDSPSTLSAFYSIGVQGLGFTIFRSLFAYNRFFSCSTLSLFIASSSMASSTAVPTSSEMVEIRANGIDIPILFPVNSDGVATVSSLHLSIRFSLQDGSIWVEREFYDSTTSLLSLTLRENPRVADNGSSMWELCAGKYRVYGLPRPCTNVSMEFRTPPHSSASTFNTPPLVEVKIEPGIHSVIHLSDSSDGDEPPVSTPVHKPSPSSLRSTFLSSPLVSPLPPSLSNPPISIVQCLRSLASMPGSKNILKKLDYNSLRIEEVEFPPPSL